MYYCISPPDKTLYTGRPKQVYSTLFSRDSIGSKKQAVTYSASIRYLAILIHHSPHIQMANLGGSHLCSRSLNIMYQPCNRVLSQHMQSIMMNTDSTTAEHGSRYK